MNKKRVNEKGFVLVTSLVFLSIMTLLGTSAAYKSVIETKVSRLSGAGTQAMSIVNAGLQKQFMEWALDASGDVEADGNRQELANILTYIAVPLGQTKPNIYLPNLTPESIGNLRNNHASGNIDTYIQGNANIRVFEMGNTGITKVANSNWAAPAKKGVPQVAIWAASYKEMAAYSDYPYKTPNSAGCPRCVLAMYALGRYGDSYRLVRQLVSDVAMDDKLAGVSAMTNAPAGSTFAELCSATASPTAATGPVTPWDPTTSGGGGNGSTVVEATQAPYVLGSVPSGTALSSNVEMGIGGKGFRSGTSSTTGASFESTPYIVYSGHGTATGVKVDWADQVHDTLATDLPVGQLPTRLIDAPLMGTDQQVSYFEDPTKQLFSMNTYRWAAEQLTCQTPGDGDGVNGNGIYCSHGEDLKTALTNMGYAALAPVTGRLTLAEFEYNVANNIPMFGMVRVMFPAEPMGASATCNIGGVSTAIELHQIDKSNAGGATFSKLIATAGGVYDGNATTLDGDGDLGDTARIIVYGSLLIDYFADYAIEAAADTEAGAMAHNGTFEPRGGERFLIPLESPDVYLAIEHNILINPAMPKFPTGDPQAFPTAATNPKPGGSADALVTSGLINMVDLNDAADNAAGNRVHLASPYDGYFPWSEGLVPRLAGEGPTGNMRLMSLTANGLVGAMQSIEAGAQPTLIPTPKMLTLLGQAKPSRVGSTAGTEADVLKYYYRLMVEAVQHSLPGKVPAEQAWPIAAWPGNTLSGDFYMGEADKVNINNDGDKMHLMFPSGNVHGWKVALAALNIKAKEWNTILSGDEVGAIGIGQAGGLYAQLVGNCGGAGPVDCVKGKPMSLADEGFSDLATVGKIEANEKKYFYATVDGATGYALLDADWKDIPATMYSGGLLDMHAHSNMNGIIYTPGPLEWEPGNSGYDGTLVCKKWKNGQCKKWKKSKGPHLSYVTGSIITGFGSYAKNKTANDRYVIVFDMQAVDNISIQSGKTVVIIRRYAWQELR